MLDIQNVSKKYMTTTAVKSANAQISEGRLVALLGPNGSGKTTLMKMIAGLTMPSEGTITYNGEKIGTATKRSICYMPTENYFYAYMTARDVGVYFADFFQDFSRIRYEELIAREKLDLKQKVRQMSSGMLAKCKLAVAFARESKITMLDEPLNGIDILARERTIEMIRENHKGDRTMIVSSHLVDELEPMLDDVIFMREGVIALAGEAKALRESRGQSIVEMYREIYGEGGAGESA